MRIGGWIVAAGVVVAALGFVGGCQGVGGAGGKPAEHNYMEVEFKDVSMYAERKAPEGKLVKIPARAVGLTGPWDEPPVPPYHACVGEFAIEAGSIPHREWADRVLVNFTQGGNVSHLLQGSLRVHLVFTEKGEFVTVER